MRTKSWNRLGEGNGVGVFRLAICILLAALMFWPLGSTGVLADDEEDEIDIIVITGGEEEELDPTVPKACVLGDKVAETWLDSDPIMKAYHTATKEVVNKWDKISSDLFLSGGVAATDATAADDAKAETLRDDYKTKFQTEIGGTLFKWALAVSKGNNIECFNCEMLNDWGYLGKLSVESDPFEIKKYRVARENDRATKTKKPARAAKMKSKVEVVSGVVIDSNTRVKLGLVTQKGMKLVHDNVDKLRKMDQAARKATKTDAELQAALCTKQPVLVGTDTAQFKKDIRSWAKTCQATLKTKCRTPDATNKEPYKDPASHCLKEFILQDIEATWKEIVDTLDDNDSGTDAKMSAIAGEEWLTDPKVVGDRCPTGTYGDIKYKGYNVVIN